jgi:hypothetical protein
MGDAIIAAYFGVDRPLELVRTKLATEVVSERSARRNVDPAA